MVLLAFNQRLLALPIAVMALLFTVYSRLL